MARLARVVAPGLPHHVTQRGNRRQQTFFGDDDYRLYRELMAEWCGRCGVEIWAYCLMPNHVHLIAIPDKADSLTRGIGEAHRRYTWHINRREDWRGHLWQGRFASFPMDEPHLLAAARYVELNPVRARLTRSARAYRWSSAKAHLKGLDDDLVAVSPLLDMVSDWKAFLAAGLDEADHEALRTHERTGRPLGGETFLSGLEDRLGRTLKKHKPGPKPSASVNK
ncbi:MAG: transposase [Alphaproteobacteria bacterium]|nr:transposase [Alphaproteobacteria bacterium]